MGQRPIAIPPLKSFPEKVAVIMGNPVAEVAAALEDAREILDDDIYLTISGILKMYEAAPLEVRYKDEFMAVVQLAFILRAISVANMVSPKGLWPVAHSELRLLLACCDHYYPRHPALRSKSKVTDPWMLVEDDAIHAAYQRLKASIDKEKSLETIQWVIRPLTEIAVLMFLRCEAMFEIALTVLAVADWTKKTDYNAQDALFGQVRRMLHNCPLGGDGQIISRGDNARFGQWLAALMFDIDYKAQKFLKGE